MPTEPAFLPGIVTYAVSPIWSDTSPNARAGYSASLTEGVWQSHAAGSLAASPPRSAISAGADQDLRPAGPPGVRGAAAARGLSWICQGRQVNNNRSVNVPPAVRATMDDPKAWEWANRYGAPDGGLSQAIRELHGVKAKTSSSAAVWRAVELHHDCALIGDPKKKVLASTRPMATLLERRRSDEKRSSAMNGTQGTRDHRHREQARRRNRFIYIVGPNNRPG